MQRVRCIHCRHERDVPPFQLHHRLICAACGRTFRAFDIVEEESSPPTRRGGDGGAGNPPPAPPPEPSHRGGPDASPPSTADPSPEARADPSPGAAPRLAVERVPHLALPPEAHPPENGPSDGPGGPETPGVDQPTREPTRANVVPDRKTLRTRQREVAADTPAERERRLAAERGRRGGRNSRGASPTLSHLTGGGR